MIRLLVDVDSISVVVISTLVLEEDRSWVGLVRVSVLEGDAV